MSNLMIGLIVLLVVIIVWMLMKKPSAPPKTVGDGYASLAACQAAFGIKNVNTNTSPCYCPADGPFPPAYQLKDLADESNNAVDKSKPCPEGTYDAHNCTAANRCCNTMCPGGTVCSLDGTVDPYYGYVWANSACKQGGATKCDSSTGACV